VETADEWLKKTAEGCVGLLSAGGAAHDSSVNVKVEFFGGDIGVFRAILPPAAPPPPQHLPAPAPTEGRPVPLLPALLPSGTSGGPVADESGRQEPPPSPDLTQAQIQAQEKDLQDALADLELEEASLPLTFDAPRSKTTTAAKGAKGAKGRAPVAKAPVGEKDPGLTKDTSEQVERRRPYYDLQTEEGWIQLRYRQPQPQPHCSALLIPTPTAL